MLLPVRLLSTETHDLSRRTGQTQPPLCSLVAVHTAVDLSTNCSQIGHISATKADDTMKQSVPLIHGTMGMHPDPTK